MTVPQIPKQRPHRAATESPSIPKSRPEKRLTDLSETSLEKVPIIPKNRPSKIVDPSITTSEPAVKHSEDEENVLNADSSNLDRSVDVAFPKLPISRPKVNASNDTDSDGNISNKEMPNYNTKDKSLDVNDVTDNLVDPSSVTSIQSDVIENNKKEEDDKNDSVGIVNPLANTDFQAKEDAEISYQDAAIEHLEAPIKKPEVEEKSNVDDSFIVEEKLTTDEEPVVGEESTMKEELQIEEEPMNEEDKNVKKNPIVQEDLNNQTERDVGEEIMKSTKTLNIPIKEHTKELDVDVKTSDHVKKTLDDLDALEQELEFESSRLTLTKTEDPAIDEPESISKVKQNIGTKEIEHIDKEEDELIKMPVVPKSRPKPIVNHIHSVKVSSESPKPPIESSTHVIDKKPPPRVPKKPSSRIAQFQEMLEQQQRADLGLLTPKPKLPLKRPSTNNEIENTDSTSKIDNEDEKDIPKVSKLQPGFANNLNSMIGLALPGMSLPGIPFGGNSFESIRKAADDVKASGSGSANKPEEKETKVKDIRRGRTRGPKGRKLPAEISKVVEVNASTLGTEFTIVIKDLWRLDLGNPLVIAANTTEETPEETFEEPSDGTTERPHGELLSLTTDEHTRDDDCSTENIVEGLKEVSQETESFEHVIKEDVAKEAELEEPIFEASEPTTSKDDFDIINKDEVEENISDKPLLPELPAGSEISEILERSVIEQTKEHGDLEVSPPAELQDNLDSPLTGED